MLGITYFDGIVQILSLIVRKTSEIGFSISVSHCTENHNMDLNAWYKPPNVGFQWGNIILSIGTTLKQIWDHFMIWLHHHNITSKNCKCRTVGQRSSTVQCDIVPPWYLGIIVSIFIVEKRLRKTILDKFHLFLSLKSPKRCFFNKVVQCDMPLFSGFPTFGQKSLGGGTACFLLLFWHKLITILRILLQL